MTQLTEQLIDYFTAAVERADPLDAPDAAIEAARRLAHVQDACTPWRFNLGADGSTTRNRAYEAKTISKQLADAGFLGVTPEVES